MNTLGIGPRASSMLSGCDTTTPCALETKTPCNNSAPHESRSTERQHDQEEDKHTDQEDDHDEVHDEDPEEDPGEEPAEVHADSMRHRSVLGRFHFPSKGEEGDGTKSGARLRPVSRVL
jgi:hypothetical protein